jgi:proline iminopeptidase
MHQRHSKSDKWKTAGRAGVVGLGLTLGLIGGVGALAGAASVTDEPWLFVPAAPAAYALIAAGTVALATRGLEESRRRRWWVRVAGTAGVIGLVGLAALLVPLNDPANPPEAVPGQQFWDLPTGSRVAYVKIPAVGTPRPEPVVFVHGGPGVALMAHDSQFFGQLAQDGYDVYVYDQAGTGLSPRLADPTQYTVARNAADLEAVRQSIGAERVILIGHSWGGTVAATYLAEHPQRVEKAVFSAPGALYWGEMGSSGTGMIGRLTNDQRWQVYRALLAPRALTAYALTQLNPRAARAYASDRELDARFDVLFVRTAPGFYCDVNAPVEGAAYGMGFFANQVPQSASAARPVDPRPALRGVQTPALVLKPSCDYLLWRLAVEYRDTLPNAQMVYIPDAGHQAYEEQPELYLSAVRAFLLGEPLPVDVYTGREPPADYTGVR